MDYEKLTADDLVLCDRVRGTFEGQNRPSSERGVHAIAYELFPEVGFVIHTHQVYATALGLAGFQRGSFTGDERVRLGGVAVAEYGLSGSKKLQAGVRAAMETGAHTVFMPHHGALICGRDHEEAMSKGVRIIPHEEGDISIELHIVVEHGVNIAAVCRSIINQVRYMVSENTGASIRSIDVCVDSMNTTLE